MTTFVSSENWEYAEVDDIGLDVMEVSQIDDSLLMAFLDESNEEEAEDERLRSVIRSLEAEIHNDPKVVIMENSSSTSSNIIQEDYRSENDQDCSTSSPSESSESSTSDDIDNFYWIKDMEMDTPVTSPSDGDDEMWINDWYMDSFTGAIETGIIEMGDYEYYNDYYNNNLWQETC